MYPYTKIQDIISEIQDPVKTIHGFPRPQIKNSYFYFSICYPLKYKGMVEIILSAQFCCERKTSLKDSLV